MRKLEPNQICQDFNTQKQGFDAYLRKTGADRVIEDLSAAVADLRAGGLDVSLDLLGDPSELAYRLFPPGQLIVPIAGTLRIGGDVRLVAIATQMANKPALKVAISDLDIRFNGPKATTAPAADGKDQTIFPAVRALLYDFAGDPDALVELQKEIITGAARNAVIEAHDTARAFGPDAGTLRKQGLKVPRSPP